jgi:hypothetical protein
MGGLTNCDSCGKNWHTQGHTENCADELNNIDSPCLDCNAEAGEPCRPYCTGEAAYNEAKEANETP